MNGNRCIQVVLLLTLLLKTEATPLDEYVWKDDGYYNYKVITEWTFKGPAVTSYMLNVTSQKWLTDNDVTRSVWWHELVINIPNKFNPAMQKSAYMLIDGGSNSGNLLSKTDDTFEELCMIAESTNSVTALLRQVPNQSLMFKKDPLKKSRTEDAIIAYTWRHFIDDPSKPEWLLRMPMTKAAVKAMDSITDFVNKTTGKDITDFCVGGASKRGWTTWSTAAVDSKRVKCITPIVLDVLNFVKNLHHHFRAYGGWSFALDDYYFANITADLDHPNTQKLADIVDPYAYKDRLTMPKMVISMGNDEFFLPDDSYYYLSMMKGTTFVNMVPNDEHEFRGHELQVFLNIRSFYTSIMTGYKTPQVSWVLKSSSTGGSIEVSMDTKPVRITAWYATSLSKTRRDFRLFKLNQTDPNGSLIPQLVMWVSESVQITDAQHYSYSMDNPSQGGWTAFFIQIGFYGPNGTIFECTTETNIIPNNFPFDDCYGKSCYGHLL